MDISRVMTAITARRQGNHRLAMITAHQTAMFVRCKELPTLDSVLTELDKSKRKQQQLEKESQMAEAKRLWEALPEQEKFKGKK